MLIYHHYLWNQGMSGSFLWCILSKINIHSLISNHFLSALHILTPLVCESQTYSSLLETLLWGSQKPKGSVYILPNFTPPLYAPSSNLRCLSGQAVPEGDPAHLRPDLQEYCLAILTTEQVLDLTQAFLRSQKCGWHCIHAGGLRRSHLSESSCRDWAIVMIRAEWGFIICY